MLIDKIVIHGHIIEGPDEELQALFSSDGFFTRDGREGHQNGEIWSLADLEHFTSLKALSVGYQESIDISALSDVDNIDCLLRLSHLTLTTNGIADISSLSELAALQVLSLSFNDITDISPISL